MTSGLLDTSVVIDWDLPEVAGALPEEIYLSAVTLAELAAGPHLSPDPTERARRQVRLQQVEALLEPLAFDAAAARSYGQVVAAVVTAGRRHRGRVADLQLAATAHAHRLDLYTRNPDDFAGLGELLTVIAI